MNFFNQAVSMAKSAAEMGAQGIAAASAKVSEATGVEIPSMPTGIPGMAGLMGGDSAEAGGSGDKKEGEGEGEKKDEGEKLGRINFKLDYNFEKNTLAVTVIQCEELPAMDIGGTSDPYVKCFVLPDKKKKFSTKKLKKTLNPVYNETFVFQKLPFNEMDAKTLMFQIFDHDALGADDQIGEVVVCLSAIDLAADDITLWRDIKEPPKNVLGDICLSLRYKPQSKPPVLVCQVVQCRNLKQMDLGGASDPYVKVNHMLNGKRVKKYKTAVRMADLNPYWNASFKIPVNPYEMQKIELVIFVNDYDKFGGNDTIGWLNFSLKDTGSAGMHWREAISQPKTNVTKWHALQPLEEEEKK